MKQWVWGELCELPHARLWEAHTLPEQDKHWGSCQMTALHLESHTYVGSVRGWIWDLIAGDLGGSYARKCPRWLRPWRCPDCGGLGYGGFGGIGGAGNGARGCPYPSRCPGRRQLEPIPGQPRTHFTCVTTGESTMMADLLGVDGHKAVGLRIIGVGGHYSCQLRMNACIIVVESDISMTTASGEILPSGVLQFFTPQGVDVD